MSRKDWADFDALLKDWIPNLVYANIDRLKRQLTYYPSIEAAIDAHLWGWLTLWVPESGWTPDWDADPEDRIRLYKVINLPSLSFEVWPRAKLEQRISFRGRVFETFSQGDIHARYDLNDRQVRAFIDKVYRLSGKIVTNKFVVDVDTGEILRQISDWLFWGGRDALASCHTHPNRFLYINGYFKESQQCQVLAPVGWHAPHAFASP
jgi:hypothetical protein